MNLLEALRGGAALELPLVYSRDAVVFPKTIAPLLAATKFANAAVDEGLRGDKRVAVALLKGVGDDRGAEIEVHPVGVVARIVQQVKLPDGSSRLLVEGEARIRIKRTIFRRDHLSASVETIADDTPESSGQDGTDPVGIAKRLVKRSFAQYAELAKKVPAETLAASDRTESAHELCD
ncbi:MAG: LON peptidase substrate-binding domain-containing protein, partial [Spirochaetaceae bacterium]|nr:LON peptidase substrate-binding domain-containing protein [Spirochaetaceae bacterium]